MKFIKMHGSSNDYVYINGFTDDKAYSVEAVQPHIPLMSDRHRGIGSDGVVFILPPENKEGSACGTGNDLRMRMFNADGTEAEMCGNAIRCVGKYAFENALVNQGECAKRGINCETKAGVKVLFLDLEKDNGKEIVKGVTVDMGEPTFIAKEVPIHIEAETCTKYPLGVFDQTFEITCVSVGNPHAIIFVEDVHKIDLEGIGSAIENHPVFPNRTNVEFVQILDRTRLRMRVWERGAGETEACGTGACATAAVAHKLGLADNKVELVLNGGSLFIEIKDNNHIFMTGDAHIVFEGEFHAN